MSALDRGRLAEPRRQPTPSQPPTSPPCQQAGVLRARHALRGDVVTASPEPVGEVGARVAASPYGFALVVAADGTLVGRLRGAELAGDPAVGAEQVMEAGPSTVRPDRPQAELVERMRTHDLRFMLVTTPEGRLLGVLRRDVAQQTLGG